MKKLFMFASAAALVATSCSDDLGLKQDNGVEAKGNTVMIASLPMGAGSDAETRTTLETNAAGTSKYYTWNAGDAIGVFVADANGDDTNAVFTYSSATSQTQAQFYGDVYALDGTAFYGYYPYYQTAQLLPGTNGPTIEMSINANQNYNHTAAPASQDEYELKVPSGSFSQGAAPAVAVGTLNNGQLSMTFRACASYIVLPMITYDARTINKVTLEVKDSDGEDQVLAGKFNVDMEEVYNGYLNYEITEASEINNGTTITLNCGSGVKLAAGDKTNFWFVVPSGLELQGATLTATVYSTDGTSYVISKTFGESAPAITGANNLWVVTPETNTPWAYNATGNYTLIQNQAQFIEYAYLVTNPQAAVISYLEMMYKEPSMANYSNLPYMLDLRSNNGTPYTWNDLVSYYNPDSPDSFDFWTYVSNAKPALVVNDITFSPTALANALKAQGLDLNAITYIPKYYLDVFKAYVTNGYIAPIGGGLTYSLNGTAKLTDLTVKGSSMFVANANASTTVNNLTFNNPTLNVQGVTGNYYNLLAAPSYTYFDGVTVNGGTFTNANDKAEKCLFGYDAAVFYYQPEVNATAVVNKTTAVTNNSGFNFAYDLNINAPAYNFTNKGRGVSDFVNINLKAYSDTEASNKRQGMGALLTVNNGVDNAVELIEAIEGNKANDAITPYSVVDATTSYWTGRSWYEYTSYIYPSTAEFLAMVVQNNLSNSVTLTRNLNLMGVYNDKVNQLWWSKYGSNTVTVNGQNNTISNVWMTGYKDSANKVLAESGFISLLGWFAKVQNVTVTAVTINSQLAATTTPSIGVVAVQPSGVIKGVNLSNFIVNTKSSGEFVAKHPAVGGMFAVSYYDVVSKMTNISVTFSNYDGVAEGIATGDVVGTLLYPMNDVVNDFVNPNATNPSSNPFGVVEVTVKGQPGQASFLNMEGFSNDYYKYPIYVAGSSIGAGYSLYINLNDVQWLTQFKQGTTAATTGFGLSWSTVNPPQTPEVD